MRFLTISCEKEDDERTGDEYYLPILNPANFIDSVTNVFSPLSPCKVYTYEGQTPEVSINCPNG